MNNLSNILEEKKQFQTTAEEVGFKLSDDLCEFLNSTGGAFGKIGNEKYVNFYSYSEIIKYNRDYAVTEFLPNYLLIGTINDEALVIDLSSSYYVVPFIGMFEKNCIKVAENLEDLIKYLMI